jgi:ubiquinone/menaquinone biosynthesis C-methylase UbiE
MFRHLWSRALQSGFRLLYNEMAWTYDAVSWVVSLGEWRNWQRAALPFVTGKQVLEIGHGPGHMLVALAAEGHTVVGLDLSAFMGQRAQKQIKRVGLAVPLVQGEAQAAPFAPAIFDSVLATFPTEYVIDPATLGAVSCMLKPGGRFVIVPEGHLTGQSPLHRLIEWLFVITGQREGAFAVNQNNEWPSAEVWRTFEQQFIMAGFQVEIKPVQLARSQATIVIAYKQMEDS